MGHFQDLDVENEALGGDSWGIPDPQNVSYLPGGDDCILRGGASQSITV